MVAMSVPKCQSYSSFFTIFLPFPSFPFLLPSFSFFFFSFSFLLLLLLSLYFDFEREEGRENTSDINNGNNNK